jgi:hypothetical protein
MFMGVDKHNLILAIVGFSVGGDGATECPAIERPGCLANVGAGDRTPNGHPGQLVTNQSFRHNLN